MKKSLILIALLLSGCSLMGPKPAPVQTLRYTCGTMPLTVTLDNEKRQVSFIMDGKPLTLTQTIAASGTRYSDDNYVFWSKGQGAFIERNKKIVVNDCQLQNNG